MTIKTPAEIAAEIVRAEYGPGSDWETENELGERGLQRAQAEGHANAPDLERLIERAIIADRVQRRTRRNYETHKRELIEPLTSVSEKVWNERIYPLIHAVKEGYIR